MFFKLVFFTFLLLAIAGVGYLAITDVAVSQTNHSETIPLTDLVGKPS